MVFFVRGKGFGVGWRLTAVRHILLIHMWILESGGLQRNWCWHGKAGVLLAGGLGERAADPPSYTSPQVLRFMDHNSGMHGPYQEENLPIILGLRNAAQATVLGRGVGLLCRMDRMYFEGTITEAENTVRLVLLKQLQTDNEAEVESILADMSRIVDMPDDGEKPMCGYFSRMLSADKPLIRDPAVMEVGDKGWKLLCAKVKALLDEEDEEELWDVYNMDPFLTWRHSCHEEGSLRMRSKLRLGKQTRHLLEKA